MKHLSKLIQLQKKKKNPAFVCPVCSLLQWIGSPARLMSWTTAAVHRGDHTLQGRGTQKGIPKTGIPTKFVAWNCSPSKAGEKNSVSSLKKRKTQPTGKTVLLKKVLGGKNPNQIKPSKQTPTQVLLHKKELKINLLQPDSTVWSGPFWEDLQCRRGRERGKQATPISAWRVRHKNLPHLGFCSRMCCWYEGKRVLPECLTLACLCAAPVLRPFFCLHLLRRGSQALLNL